MVAPYIVSKVLDVPGIRHGFFGREGGRSKGDLAGNNMGINQGDNPDLVVSNRASAANAMGGYDVKDLVVFRQGKGNQYRNSVREHRLGQELGNQFSTIRPGDFLIPTSFERLRLRLMDKLM